MPFRPREPAPDVVARLHALTGAAPLRATPPEPIGSTGGWVPAQPPAPLPAPARHLPPAPLSSEVSEAPDASTRQFFGQFGGGRGDAEVDADAGLVAPGSVPQVLAAGRWDPGRWGVVALLLVGLVAAALAGVVVLRGRPSEQPLTVPTVSGGASTTPASGPELVVDVAGKVRRPGLVRLPQGARVDDALRAAGGVLPGVPTLALNLARKLADGEQVLVGVTAVGGVPGAAGSAGGLLDLNVATSKDFEELPGIGPVLAERIVDWRTEHGRFASVDQLREVTGIGEAKYASLKSKVRV